MTWEDLTQVKKGSVGEAVVNQWLIGQGYIPYSPDSSGAHPFDRLVASKDKKEIFIAETKSKAARKYYPDTGIDIKHYRDYTYIQDKYGLDVFIFFVDEEKKQVYGNMLKALDRQVEIEHNGKKLAYPREEGGIHYFSLSNMIKIADLPNSIANRLQGFTTKQDVYKHNRMV